MRPRLNVFVCLTVFGCAQFCCATPVDPQISIGDPSSGTVLTSPIFFFSADSNGGGIFSFTNGTDQVWQSLDFFATLPSTDSITCSSNIYSLCNYTATPSSSGTSVFDVGFEDPQTGAGIAPGQSFSINLDTRGTVDAGGWGADKSIQGVANLGLPEPASWTLASLGLLAGAIFAFYRRAA